MYDVGDGIRITATFTDLSGVVADPSAVVFKVKDPKGTVTIPSTAKDSTGTYHADLTLTRPGTWLYRWEGTGAVQAAIEGTISVKVSNF
jgi:hypothetical protein